MKLEVGCGPGDSGLLLKPDFAVDFSPEMVKQAKKLMPKCNIRVANAEKLSASSSKALSYFPALRSGTSSLSAILMRVLPSL